jgi:hypothetical protein
MGDQFSVFVAGGSPVFDICEFQDTAPLTTNEPSVPTMPNVRATSRY